MRFIKREKKSVLTTELLVAALVIGVFVVSQTSVAKGGNQFETLCHQTVKMDAAGKKSGTPINDAISVEEKYKSRDDNPLVYEIKTTVDNDSTFGGGMAEVTLVANPQPGVWTFDGFEIAVNPDCSATDDPVMASFNNGADKRPIDDESLEPGNGLEAAFNGSKAAFGYPVDSAWLGEEDLEQLAKDICAEVKNDLSGDLDGYLRLTTAGEIGTVQAGNEATMVRCLGNSSKVTFVGASCTADQVAAASTQVNTRIGDIPSFNVSMGASSTGNSELTVELTDNDGCTATATVDLEDDCALTANNPCGD